MKAENLRGKFESTNPALPLIIYAQVARESWSVSALALAEAGLRRLASLVH